MDVQSRSVQRQVADRLDQRHERRRRKLRRDDLGHPVVEHLGGQREADEEPEPFVQGDVLAASAVESRPDDGGDEATKSSQNVCTQKNAVSPLLPV